MREIEVKILEVNKKEVERKLISLGAKKIFDDVLEAKFFDFLDQKLKKKNITLRLRKEGNENIIGVKKFLSKKKAKIMQETETRVFSFIDTEKMLLDLGLKIWRKTKKHRVSYKLRDTRFEIDRFLDENNFIPEFLEIEAKDVKTCYEYARLLGFKEKDCLSWGFSDLIRYYKK